MQEPLLELTFYHPQTNLREGNVFTPVYDSNSPGGGQVYPSIQWEEGDGVCIHMLPRADTPLGKHDPLERQTPRDGH